VGAAAPSRCNEFRSIVPSGVPPLGGGTLACRFACLSSDSGFECRALLLRFAMPESETPAGTALVASEFVERRIHVVRGQKVMLDSDLAEVYGVPTFRLNEAVKRNRERFPPYFMFQLTNDEALVLTSQIAMSKPGRGGRRTLPYAFTEHGVPMLSSVLNSPRAVQMNIVIIRAFVHRVSRAPFFFPSSKKSRS
jgi:hypothetical protein